ncbi:MAG: hypothetical protein AAE977_02510 [Thermoplasmataceae archaeon]|jgi:hypothetical protein
MAPYEVYECTEEKSNNGTRRFRVIAIDYRDPTFLDATCNSDLKKGTLLDVQGKDVFFQGQRVGSVQKLKDASSIRVSTNFDVKYTGGYSLDGKIVYLDEHFPQKLQIKGKIVDARESIGLHHELPEKWLSDQGYEYPYAHEMATGIEKKYVESLGIAWKDYCDEVDRNLRNVYRRTLEKSPPSLDLAPYLYCRDQEALKEIRKSKQD